MQVCLGSLGFRSLPYHCSPQQMPTYSHPILIVTQIIPLYNISLCRVRCSVCRGCSRLSITQKLISPPFLYFLKGEEHGKMEYSQSKVGLLPAASAISYAPDIAAAVVLASVVAGASGISCSFLKM